MMSSNVWVIKKIFIGLLFGLVNGSDHAKCVSLSNQTCMTQELFVMKLYSHTMKK